MNHLIESILGNGVGLAATALALGSALVYMLLANLAGRVGTASGSAAEQTRAFVARRDVQSVYEVARLLYYVGVPFLALYSGLIDLRAMGLGSFDWADGTRWTIILILAGWVLLLVIWLPYLRATADVPAPPSMRGHTLSRRIVEMIYMQAHWAFYRAAAIVLLTGAVPDPFYWGTVLGLGLILVEAFADPRVRAQLTRVGEADVLIWNAAQAVINGIGFLVTRNLWLLLVIHFFLEFTVPHLRPAPPTARPQSLTRR